MQKNSNQEFQLTDLYLYLTDQCNLCCGHCWISPGFSQDQQNSIPLDVLKNTIYEAKSLGLQSVKLTGGEPFLYRDIRGLLQFLATEDLSILIETNGVLLDRSMVELLKDCKVDQISVSLDAATEALHDEIRGVKGSFRKAVNRLRLLSDFGLSYQVIMTLQRKNSKEIPALMRLCHELGASSLKINPLQPCGRAIAAFEQNANLNLDELILLHRDLSKEGHKPDVLDVCFDLPLAFLSIDEILQTSGRCWILNILGVLANGDFSICGIGQTANELRMGNLFRDPISEVWKYNPLLIGLRQSLPWKLEGICNHCIFKFQCLGACRANAFIVSKDLYAPYFLCQELYEAGRFPESRYL